MTAQEIKTQVEKTADNMGMSYQQVAIQLWDYINDAEVHGARYEENKAGAIGLLKDAGFGGDDETLYKAAVLFAADHHHEGHKIS